MIIGISGQAGSGKDTCADFIVEDYQYVKISLADPLKRICQDVFDFSDKQLWGPSQYRNEPDKRYPRGFIEKIPQYLTCRYALQQLGTDWGRDCYDNIWIDYAIRTANIIEKAYIAKAPVYYNQQMGLVQESCAEVCFYRGVVIPDVRFRNEIDAIHKANGKVFRVVRPGAGLEGEAAAHKSEAEMRDMPDSLFDEVIQNDGTLDDLETKISNLMRLYR
jgi:hypothetical protein